MIIAGIDEAGYGPLLGPLCVAMVVIRINDRAECGRSEQPGEKRRAGVPDLWAMLRPAVVPEPRLAGPTAIAVADSKRLKLPNSSKTKHPLHHLERGVLAMGSDPIRAAVDDFGLCSAVGAALPVGRDWWAGPGVPLPLGCSADELSLLSAHVSAACERAGVRTIEARCLAMDAPEFNAALRTASRRGPLGSADFADSAVSAGQANKASVLFGQALRHLRRLWASSEAVMAGEDPRVVPPRVVVDRQGGRTDYLGVLTAGFPEARVHCLGVGGAGSSYEIKCAGDRPRRMRVLFRSEAESHALPVALASMLAKLVRELWMIRFNAYWCAMMPELKPTAGYVADGRRWLDEAQGVLDGEVRALLCRER